MPSSVRPTERRSSDRASASGSSGELGRVGRARPARRGRPAAAAGAAGEPAGAAPSLGQRLDLDAGLAGGDARGELDVLHAVADRHADRDLDAECSRSTLGQQRVDDPAVAVGRGVEPVGAPQVRLLVRTRGPSRSPSETAMPPASTAATVCAAASAPAPTARRSCAAAACSGLTRAEVGAGADDDDGAGGAQGADGAARSRAAAASGTRCVTSLAPMMITAASTGRRSARATCTSRSAERAPVTATTSRSTRRRRSRAMPAGEQRAGRLVGAARSPSPAAAESPRTTRCSGLLAAAARPYDPAARGACSVGWPIVLRASLASVASSAYADAGERRRSAPPPYAALTAT